MGRSTTGAALFMLGLAGLVPMTALAQSGAPAPAAPMAAPATTPPATTPSPAEEGPMLGQDIIITPSFLPTPEEVKAFHDEEYGRLKGMFAPEARPVSRGDSLTRNNTQNTGTVAGAKSVNCASVGECRSVYTADK
ncbi:hypothetical protein UCD39_06325 [Nitrospirillum sp. BR 11752]|uniref:hypothetical protein n=1 Tax=Nitrospirillum sp. BR 11752 TaxID=3104293 RepID=UPI002EBBD090|nr:hypothetical protein [Nitrospirillum sp. BR 11752]